MQKPLKINDLKGFFCARDWIRTSTSLRTLRPEHSASTNFATRAITVYRLTFKVKPLILKHVKPLNVKRLLNAKRVANITTKPRH